MLYIAIVVAMLFILFWSAQLIFVKRHLDWTNEKKDCDKDYENVRVTVIHPIKELDFELEKNLESWYNQNHRGLLEHIFSFQEPMTQRSLLSEIL